jgi:serine/threonine protein phosphatase PrpC
VRFALQRGREHTELGAIDIVAEGSGAIAISIGGAKKRYAHVDPNEDSALLALGPAGMLVAVADGHHGFEAAEVALEYLANYPAPHWTEPGTVRADTWRRQVGAVLEDTNRAIRAERPGSAEGSCTTLAMALVLPKDGALLYATIGDSHLYRAVRDGTVRDLAAPREEKPCFLGAAEADAASLLARARVGTAPLSGTQALVLVTDGLTERGIGVEDPEAAVRDAITAASTEPPQRRTLVAARGVVDRACAAHRAHRAGDNVACAVVWLGRERS